MTYFVTYEKEVYEKELVEKYGFEGSKEQKETEYLLIEQKKYTTYEEAKEHYDAISLSYTITDTEIHVEIKHMVKVQMNPFYVDEDFWMKHIQYFDKKYILEYNL